MDPHHVHESGGNLEDQLRRMILLNGSTPDEDTTPKVRLPSSYYYSHGHGAQHQPPGPPQTVQKLTNISSSNPGVSHSQQHPSLQPLPPGLPAQMQQPVLPPHLRRPSRQQDTPFRAHSNQYSTPPPLQQAMRMQGPSDAHHSYPAQHQQRQHQISLDPDAFNRSGPKLSHSRHSQQPRALYDPNGRVRQQQYTRNDQRDRQAQYLDQIAASEVPKMEMTTAERVEKDAFRQNLQTLCEEVCQEKAHLPQVSLECFGSFQSGFASAGSDMDLVIVVHDQNVSSAAFSLMEDDLPRALEGKLLRSGYGARLLTRTRVPIIKICEKPSENLLDELRAERERWDILPNEKKYPHLHSGGDDDDPDHDLHDANRANPPNDTETAESVATITTLTNNDGQPLSQKKEVSQTEIAKTTKLGNEDKNDPPDETPQFSVNKHHQAKAWTRERKPGPLDFPKDGIGIQCDINFFNPLGLHNTQMLRCYSLCDPRVRPIVLFVKAWAKLRRINSSYSGTLSSYGYVLMVLHYLMNEAEPPVIPNLQSSWRPNGHCTEVGAEAATVDGWSVDFWRNEEEIFAAVQNGQMSANRESIGSLLVGFFQYYASMGHGPAVFHWMNEVLSLRSPRGILTKVDKGWVKATTEEAEGKRIQHRYLFCIEDPFELTHNVARTVTHNGIVAIRDEFRRANRILQAVGWGKQPHDGHLFAKLMEVDDTASPTLQLQLSNETTSDQTVSLVALRRDTNSQSRQPRLSAQRPMHTTIHQGGSQPQAPRVKSKPLDLADQEAFPSLGSGTGRKPRQNKGSSSAMNGEGSIAGDKAQAYLEEFRRKKAEQEAEFTAMGAAEAVLNGDD